MSETKWTPGPWTPQKLRNGQQVVLCESGFPVCRISRWAKESDAAEARLIAAAPDLYDALSDAIEVLALHVQEGDGIASPVMDNARAALAKALGASPGNEGGGTSSGKGDDNG